MRKYLFLVFGVFIGLVFFTIPKEGRGEGEVVALFEDSVEFNSVISIVSSLKKSHTIGPIPEDSIIFFNLFCEGNASVLGGTENVTRQEPLFMNPDGSGEFLFDMTICEFCACADVCAGKEGNDLQACLNSDAFKACHDANESCATFNNAKFAFSPFNPPGIMPDPDFPDAQRVLFTMTEHDPPTACKGPPGSRLANLCQQNKLNLEHYCIHLFDSMGDIVKSVASSYIFNEIK
jgi:hypothetical protein